MNENLLELWKSRHKVMDDRELPAGCAWAYSINQSMQFTMFMQSLIQCPLPPRLQLYKDLFNHQVFLEMNRRAKKK